MKLGTATTDIADMFSGKKQYQIPFYQRRYVWDQKNWEPLWEDIIQLPEKHFAGTIITYEQRDKSVEIVDGQQRLTTFQIIFCVIRDLWDLKAYPASEEDTSVVIERKRSEIIRYIVQDAPGEPPRILPAKRDREYFESVFSRKLWEKLNIQEPSACLNAFKSLQDSSEHPIIAAYGFFWVKDYNLS